MIQNPSYAELQKAANQGRRCTWEKLSAIRANCAIELALDECVALLNHLRRLKRSAERASASQGYGPVIRFCPSRRIPSWNLIARENSTGSLDEEMLESPHTNHQGPGGVAGTSTRNRYFQRNAHESSDSESESIDLHSWTRNGGPLMRTASANKFISFVQNLEIDTEFRTIPSRENLTDLVTPNAGSLAAHAVNREATDRSLDISALDIHDTATPRSTFGRSTSIVVSEGDLLQPEKIENGILFNVVRRDTLLRRSFVDDDMTRSAWDIVQSFAPREQGSEPGERVDTRCNSDTEEESEAEDGVAAVEGELKELRIGETFEGLTGTSSLSTTNDDDASSTTTEAMFIISPNGKFKRKIKSWMRGALLGSGSFGMVYEGISE
jgi:hypothetical protein